MKGGFLAVKIGCHDMGIGVAKEEPGLSITEGITLLHSASLHPCSQAPSGAEEILMGDFDESPKIFIISISNTEFHADALMFGDGEVQILNRRIIFEADRLEVNPREEAGSVKALLALENLLRVERISFMNHQLTENDIIARPQIPVENDPADADLFTLGDVVSNVGGCVIFRERGQRLDAGIKIAFFFVCGEELA